MNIVFVTSNPDKVREANEFGQEYGVSFSQVNMLYSEVRAESVSKVALEGAKYVGDHLDKPAIVEDSGLFIDCIKGFPGVYSAYCFKRIGNRGILDILRGRESRTASFISSIGYAHPGGVKTFEGIVKGKISQTELGANGFGYDPIFIPEGSDLTFAQDPGKKRSVSHRRQAFRKFCEHLM